MIKTEEDSPLTNSESNESLNTTSDDVTKNFTDFLQSFQNFSQEITEKLENQSQKIDKITEKQDKMMTEFESMKNESKGRKRGRNEENGDENEAKRMDIQEEFEEKPQSLILPTIFPVNSHKFHVKHIFKNISKMVDGKHVTSDVEEHFGIPWKNAIRRQDGYFIIILGCVKPPTGSWLIEMDYEMRIKYFNQRTYQMKTTHCFTKESRVGCRNFMKLEDFEKDFIGDTLTVEMHCNITKITGIYPKNLRNFDDSECFDVVLAVKNQKFHVSKLTLATHSPYFKALFLGQFQDSTMAEIALNGIDPWDFQKYLEVIYAGNAIDESTVEGILHIADMYDTPIVTQKCEQFLMKNSKKPTKKKLEMAARYNLFALKKSVMKGIESPADMRTVIPDDINDMDPSIMGELFMKLLDSKE